MDYKWKIKLVMDNGMTLLGVYRCACTSSFDVGKTLLCGNNDTFNTIGSEDGKSQIFFRLGDVSAMEISA